MSRRQPGTNPVFIGVITLSVFLIIGLIKNAIDLYQSRGRLETVQQTVDQLQAQKQQLKQTLLLQSDPAFLDQTIHNQLNLAKPGETIISISGSDSTQTNQPSPSPKPKPSSTLSQWWQLLNPS